LQRRPGSKSLSDGEIPAMRTLVAAVAVLALSGCLDPSGTNYRFQGQVQNLNAAPNPPTPVEVENLAAGALSITGGATTPCWEEGVTVDGDKSGRTLTVTVDRTVRNPCNDQRTRHHIFIGIFSNLRPGTYTVRVIDETTDASVVMLDTNVQVQ
jgi:hypothetical protein